MLKSREKTFQLSLTLKDRILSRFRSVGQIFCLGLGLYRLTSPATDILQRVLNAAARVITDTRKFDRGLRQILHNQLHWLDVPDRVLVKLAVTVHQCLNGRAQPYLSEHCIPVSSADTRRHLRSANYFLYRVSGQHLRPSAAGPMAWILSAGSNEQHRLF